MTQTRLFFRAALPQAQIISDALEIAFEDEGYPIAMVEIDEDRALHEISLYTDHPDAARTRLDKTLADFPDVYDVGSEAVPDIDWVVHSLQGLKPVRAGRFFVHGRHDRGERRTGDIPIEIEAALAFGTGHHGTTSGCLDMLWRITTREHPKNALDLGTGSAVLAIAIAKHARIPVLATDIDPVATRTAARNVRLNGVAALVETRTASGFHDSRFAELAPFDLIVANILARPLMALAWPMSCHLAPGGSLVLSGILARQRRAVLAAYAVQHFRHLSTLEREGWVTIHLKRG